MLVSHAAETGAAALARGDWEEARNAFEAALEHEPSADALDGLGEALWWLRQPAAAIEARTQAYAAFRRAGRTTEAARVAVWLAREHLSLFGNESAARGWLARAATLADHPTASSIPGWVHLVRAALSPDVEHAVDSCRTALAIARRHDDPDLEIVSLARLGVLQVGAGAIDQGIAHLDEAMAASVGGEARRRQTLGEAYCAVMEAADLLGDTERLVSWVATMEGVEGLPGSLQIGRGLPLTRVLSSFCGACCGGIYMVTGRIDEAEAELLAAVAELESAGMHSRCVHPVTQLAELRVLQGRIEEAALLLQRYEDLPEATRPLAMVELALGQVDGAVSLLRSGIERLASMPVAAFPLWVLLTEAQLAGGDLEAAGMSAARVREIAAWTASGRHEGQAFLCEGRLLAAREDPMAVRVLAEAARQLASAALPLLACRARLARARAAALSDPGLAIAEGRAALAGFERMGAGPDADAAAAFLRELGVKGRTGAKNLGLLTARETEVLRLIGQGMSNPQIADRLYISVKTAGHHVSSILTKLGLRSRTEAAAFVAINPPPDRATK